MKKQLFLLAMVLLPMVANAHDIEVQNADGVTIYYNYTNGGKELAVTYRGSSRGSYFYTGSIVIPESVNYNAVTYSVTSIGSSAFYDCTGLTSVSIPNSVTSIGSSAFYDCTGFTSITIPNSVTSIGYNAFYGCSGLKKVIVSDIAAWCGMIFGDNPLSYAKHLYSDENTEITDLVIPNSVKAISNNAFLNCSGLTSLTLNNVKDVGSNAFSGCTGLSSVHLNSVKYIASSAFSGCTGLTSIEIPNSVISIGGGAFGGCAALTSVTLNSDSIVSADRTVDRNNGNTLGTIFGHQVTEYIIGEGVTRIGICAFHYNYKDNDNFTSITIPNSVTSIGYNAFYGCSGLKKVIVPDIAAWCGMIFGDNPLSYAKHLYSDENRLRIWLSPTM